MALLFASWGYGSSTKIASLGVMPVLMGFFMALFEASRNQFVYRRVIRAYAQWRRGLWRPSQLLALIVGNAICWGLLFFVVISLIPFVLGRGAEFTSQFSEHWPRALIVASALSLFNLVSGNDATAYLNIKKRLGL